MNYTENHHLPQWAGDDRIRMDDFNNAMASIESGLVSNAQAAEKAQATADAASQLPYSVGSYTGGGGGTIVHVGFKPSFVIVSGLNTSSAQGAPEDFGAYSCITAGKSNLYSQIQFFHSGFEVLASDKWPRLTESGRKYEFIAFR